MLPFRRYVEMHSYFEMLGKIDGFSVLDLACGEGFYTRRVQRRGAGKVVGVDISEGMINLAREAEKHNPLGIDYVTADIKGMGRIGQFDRVVASYLLNYARTGEELFQMCRTIALNLKPGGKFVSINNNPDQPPESFPLMRKYGFGKRLSGGLEEGAVITYEFFREGQQFSIDNFYLSRETHKQAFTRAGLQNVIWEKIQVSSEGINEYGREHWNDFLTFEPVVGIQASKPETSA